MQIVGHKVVGNTAYLTVQTFGRRPRQRQRHEPGDRLPQASARPQKTATLKVPLTRARAQQAPPFKVQACASASCPRSKGARSSAAFVDGHVPLDARRDGRRGRPSAAPLASLTASRRLPARATLRSRAATPCRRLSDGCRNGYGYLERRRGASESPARRHPPADGARRRRRATRETIFRALAARAARARRAPRRCTSTTSPSTAATRSSSPCTCSTATGGSATCSPRAERPPGVSWVARTGRSFLAADARGARRERAAPDRDRARSAARCCCRSPSAARWRRS